MVMPFSRPKNYTPELCFSKVTICKVCKGQSVSRTELSSQKQRNSLTSQYRAGLKFAVELIHKASVWPNTWFPSIVLIN